MDAARIRSITRRFGTQEELAKALKLGGPTTISRWIQRERIPAWHQQQLLRLAHERGISLKPEEFFEGAATEMPAPVEAAD